MKYIFKFIAIFIMIFPIVTHADKVKLSGYVAMESRVFTSDAQFDNQFNGVQSSLILQPEFSSQTVNGMDKFSFVPFARLDNRDDNRSHTDLREAYWLHNEEQWNLLVGVNRVFWGVAESNHLVDIINQTDLVDSVNGEEKLGQPLVNITTEQEWGRISFFIMPYFRERTYPSEEGRLRSDPVVAQEVLYESRDEQHHMDLALRYSHYIGEWDFGVYYFKGTGREPRFASNGNQLIAQYDQIEQIGTDVQFTNGAWLWKFEGINRLQNNKRFNALVSGFEYTLYQITNSAADLGLLLEYMHDSRDKNSAKAPPVDADDDIFLAARLALNDTQDSEMLIGVVIDRNDHSKVVSIEIKRRLNSHWKLELESRWFKNSKENTLLSQLKKDSFIALRIARYF